MNYRFATGEDLGDEVRRVAREQLDAAIAGLAPSSDPAEGVHETRRRLKRVRALMRIARGPLGKAYSTENERFRDVARALADVRDAQVARETFERVFPHPRSSEATALRDRLAMDQTRSAAAEAPLDRRLRRLRKELIDARRQVESWPLETLEGFASLEEGIARSYRRGRRGLARAQKSGDPRDFHEWRKRVKYHREHVRLLQDTWKEPLRERRRSLSRLSALLGEAHDLFMLRQWLMGFAAGPGADGPDEEILTALDERRRALEQEALPLGRRLFVEKPERLVRRLRVFWEARTEEAERLGEETTREGRRRTA